MVTPVSFFSQHPLPIFGMLSPLSLEALGEYLNIRNKAHRERQVLEFFRRVDWLSLDELYTLKQSPLRRLTLKQQMVIYQDIKNYLNQKNRQQKHRSDQRKSHKLRVFDYFKEKIPRKDKTLLEQLRDFELHLTGWDKNWQHYFAMHSFKKIDDFLALSNAQRLQLIQRFKQDVLTYQKNLERLQRAQKQKETPYSFDDWCNDADQHIPTEDIFKTQHQREYKRYRQHQNHSHSSNPVPNKRLEEMKHDYYALGLKQNASLPQVKKQFRQLALTHHPDLPNGSSSRMKELLAAYDRIKRHLSLHL